MKTIGIIKETDRLGRLHIPKELRMRPGLSEKVELVATKEGLLIKSVEYELKKRDTDDE